MTMAMISPSRSEVSRQNSSARALDWFRLVAAEFCPGSLLMIFFQDKRLHIAEDATRGLPEGPRGRGAPPPSWTVGGPLWYFFLLVFFINSKNDFLEVSGLLELCRIGL